VKPNYARADLLEKLPEKEDDEDENEEAADEAAEADDSDEDDDGSMERLGSRDNFWGN
jgi:hypothetical protein